MVESITATCEWCEETRTFDGPDPEKEWREAGWFQFQGEEEDMDFCSKACAVSWLT